MKILLDECIPRKLQYSLPDVSTPLMQLIAPVGASFVVLRRTGIKGGDAAREYSGASSLNQTRRAPNIVNR